MYSQLIASTLLAAAAFAQAPATKEPPTPPRISAEARAKFWRTQAEAIAAATRAERAQEAAKAAQEEMRKTCGDKFVVVLDGEGEPSCQAKQ
jgi:sensor histidine kinase regulating citrate/malate metabolism